MGKLEIWDRLTKRPDGTPIGLPTHLFLFITLIFGVSFSLPPEFFAVGLSQLYQFSTGAHPLIPLVWGLWLLLTSVLNTVMLLTRTRRFGAAAGMMGFLGWLYAAIAYISIGFWLGLFTAAVPLMLFWAWYYLRVKNWSRTHSDLRPPSR